MYCAAGMDERPSLDPAVDVRLVVLVPAAAETPDHSTTRDRALFNQA
jgi:hypothetical protein